MTMQISRVTPEEVREITSGKIFDRICSYPVDIPLRPNLPLLRKIRDWVVEQNRLDRLEEIEWDQSQWFKLAGDGEIDDKQWDELVSQGHTHVCGSHQCVAGQVAISYGEPLTTLNEAEMTEFVRSDEDGLVYSISNLACRKLGIDGYWGSSLFDGDNEEARVLEILDRLILLGEEQEKADA